MRKVFFLLGMFFLTCMTISAQSTLTDEQVIKFVMKEQKAGSTQQEIAVKLVQKGVTTDQIKRVQKKVERLKNNEGLGTVNDKTLGTDKRQRKANGDPKKDNNSTQKLKDKSPRRIVSLDDEEEQEETEDYKAGLLKKDMDEFMPDSFDLYDRKVIQDYLKAKDEYEKKAQKKIFGHDLFQKEDLTFEPPMNVATPQNYVLGPGDVVFIDIYGASQKSVEATITPDGQAMVEDFGPIQIGGLTVAQASQRVKAQLKTRYSSSQIMFSVGQTRTITVNVMGEVTTPGSYTLSAFATVFHALYMAGGPNEIGTLRNIKVYRNNRLISTVDVYDYILNGNLKGNVRLADNDVITVGTYDCLVSANGKVKRPMYYEMKRNESMKSLINYAGDFASDAYRKSVRVIRKMGSQMSVFNVNEFDMSSFKIADGDSVLVDSILNRYENMVEVKGAVFRPGMYQLGGQINSVKTLMENCEGVTEEAFTAHAVMHRMKKDRTLEVVPVDLAGIMDGSASDIMLQNEDVLFVPTRQDVQEEQTITIHGEVQYPGVYRYADNETLEDFVLQAGGLKETAAMVNVFVSRRIINPKATETDSILGHSFSFALKDGFVIDGEPGFHLQPFDEVFVRKSPGYKIQQNVTVEGEVQFSGDYSLTKQNERLSDLIKKAGGVTSIAYVAGARLERKMNEAERIRYEESVKMQQQQNEAAMMEQALKSGRSVSEMKAANQTAQEKLKVPETYFVGIELDKALEKPGSDADIVLREGDRLVVPGLTSTVKISGEVMYPNTVGFAAGKKAKYYINQAGGYSAKAKKKRTYIIYMNGDVAKVTGRTKVRPGCEIVVPQKSINKMTTAETVTLGSGIASIATMIATLANILTK
ncbi:SLBB domain-containing protein [Prevotella sp. E15-22]|uniref:polysaccharide biosynthesis/export family protein n=1 Tax=Prevotella sp. E15-22 TaxID=2937774 RepID=UPI002069DF0F|nr:SLBB domain-containing protein [Prevotella sp. E15-22]UPS45233.1 SLBB domain-containing protein [Prevotella sp. E15-22]